MKLVALHRLSGQAFLLNPDKIVSVEPDEMSAMFGKLTTTEGAMTVQESVEEIAALLATEG